MPLCVMLASVVDNFSPERGLVIHVLSDDSGPSDKERLQQSLKNVRRDLEHVEVHWHAISNFVSGRFPAIKGTHVSADTYSRIFAPLVLPDTCSRALYLDCDLVALADVAELYDSTAGMTTVVQAVTEVKTPFVSSPGGVFDYAERGLPPQTPYFNAGVLVINVALWRKLDLTSQILEYMEREADHISWWDQGALNAFLARDWSQLDLRWNQTTYLLDEENRSGTGIDRAAWNHALHHPAIVHYIGPGKPWLADRPYLPRRAYFFRYLQKTVYRDTISNFPHLETLLGTSLYYRLWKLGQSIVPRSLRVRRFEKRHRQLIESAS